MTSWCVFVFGLISDLWNVICKERTKMYKQNLRQVRNWVFQRSAFYYKVFNWLSMCIIITIVFSNTAQSAYFIMLMLQAKKSIFCSRVIHAESILCMFNWNLHTRSFYEWSDTDVDPHARDSLFILQSQSFRGVCDR